MPSSNHRNPLIWLVLLPLLSFIAGHILSLQQAKERAVETGSLIQSHLEDILCSKDDMALIDWAKGLEKRDEVLAFRVTTGPKTMIEGGNRTLVPTSSPLGSSYLFPDLCVVHLTSNIISQGPIDVLVIHKALPNPWVGGALGGLLSLLTALLVQFSIPNKASTISGPIAPPIRTNPNLSSTTKARSHSAAGPFLFLDKNFTITQVSPEAAQLLGKSLEDLTSSHLLDLSPAPALMQAIEKGVEADLSEPFPSRPGLTSRIQPTSDGTFLHLKVQKPSQPPQNH